MSELRTSDSCTCQTVSDEYSDHRFECPVYVAGKAARIARTAGTKRQETSKPMDEVLEFLRSFIYGGVNQDFRPWARELYAKLYGSPSETADGLPESQEPKYTVANGRLVNRATGKPIPDDEPVFILRAKDREAVYALMDYRSRCRDADHHAAVDARVGDFLRFKEAHPMRMKAPDTTSLKANEQVDSVRVRVCDCNPVQAAECDEVENQTGTRPGYCRAESEGEQR